MRKTMISLGLALFALLLQAQTRREMGGIYCAYPSPLVESGKPAPQVEMSEKDAVLAAPAGYVPFYISHYGRHGSRWMPSDERYVWICQHFEDASNLTPLGKKVRKLLDRVLENARGNGGKLSRLGALQHQGIANRMYRRFPEVFVDATHVQARSSVVDRCAKSMQAFTGELRRLNPSLDLDVKTDSADMAWIAYTSPEVKDLEKRTQVVVKVATDRFMRQLFKDITKVDNPVKLMSEIHAVTSSIQDVGLNFKRYPKDIEKGLNELFTDDEFRAFYEANNKRMTICNGYYPTNGEAPAMSAISLWQNFQEEADAALLSDKPSATLRFGHDTALYRLLSLLNCFNLYELWGDSENVGLLANDPDRMNEVVPMAANLQLVFYRYEPAANLQQGADAHLASGQDTYLGDSVIVQVLINEHSQSLFHCTQPLDLKNYPDSWKACFYSWKEIKAGMRMRLHELEHLRQLNMLNTMVGTAQANTNTAGAFGKGSEEHGQTLPAVLVPNGQNSWTPQTRDTEQKCIAPYYYMDTELQGFRNSHWLVGGCTQDYGSFTVATLGDSLRLQPEERATPFSHEDEVSHPYYYSVKLPKEHLMTEMTADSHAACFQVYPDKDENVHIVINPNSDEGQGYVEVDTLNHRIYGYNPVHRIYQGWGEPAGFSGHFVLEYGENEDLLDFGVFGNDMRSSQGLSEVKNGEHPGIIAAEGKRVGAWLTFKGVAGEPIRLQAASSFTSKEGAVGNLTEAFTGFHMMLRHAISRWADRFHTIDVESKDMAKVNQFYGAFYRASFLPREMSDVCGAYPSFSKDEKTSVRQFVSWTWADENTRLTNGAYGDFSMWDIYRAELPLYHIITPGLAGNMMQSLVNMYKEGGWMPIFPCWNSYTAAMIGDHAGAALADAYVKGVRGFDVKTAYEGMRKNAFESPTSFEEYKNGMGRRALKSYLKYGYIPMEDSVKEAFHQNEQTSRTLEYAFDDFAVAQMAKALADSDSILGENGKMEVLDRKSLLADYRELMRRSENWRMVINPKTGWADGRHQNGKWENNLDLVHRKSYITEGATCHYTWYVPQNVEGLFEVVSKSVNNSSKSLDGKAVVARLDQMFDEGLYWHGNEPCHQVAYLYDVAGAPEKGQQRIRHILETEYNDTPGGLSGNDDAGQMSAWYIFSSIGFYPVCPSTPNYYIGVPSFDKVTFNLENDKQFIVTADGCETYPLQNIRLNGKPVKDYKICHDDILRGGTLWFGK